MFTSDILGKKMDYLHQILLKSSYPDWIIKKPEKKPQTPIINPETGLEVQKKKLISVSYVPGLGEEFRRTFNKTNVQVIFVFHEDKVPFHLK